jgi:hypothetical protein
MTERTINTVLAPISVAEALDKLTILEIKEEKITDPDKLLKIRYETHQLEMALDHLLVFETVGIQELYAALDGVNRRLWDIEDELRTLEQKQDFGQNFITLARSVYKLNDERARFKREINVLLNSEIEEVKSYAGM